MSESNDELLDVGDIPTRDSIKPQNDVKVTLAELKAASTENEAETAILQAIEDELAEKNSSGAGANLLPGVPDGSTKIFEIKKKKEEDGDPEKVNEEDDESHHLSLSMVSVMVRKAHKVANVLHAKDNSAMESTEDTPPFEDKTELSGTDVGDVGNPFKVGEERAGNRVYRNASDTLMWNAGVLFQRAAKAKAFAKASESEKPAMDIETGGQEEDEEANESKCCGWLKKKHPKKTDCTEGEGSEHLTLKIKKAEKEAIKEMENLISFLKTRKLSIWIYCKSTLTCVILPALVIAVILFYAGNPIACDSDNCASYSWWIIFLFIRQVITLSGAAAIQVLVIDLACFNSRWVTRLLGPMAVLFVIQSRGWPFLGFTWAILDFLVLFGKSQFVHHWMFYAEIPFFSSDNPSGTVTSSQLYRNCIMTVIFVCVLAALKRLWLGISFGRKTYATYNKQFTELLYKIMLIGDVANLGAEIHARRGKISRKVIGMSVASLRSDEGGEKDPDPEDEDDYFLSRRLTASQQLKINELLGEWDEPLRVKKTEGYSASIGDILNFRQALEFMDDKYPFSIAFGKAKTRVDCIESAQTLYNRLLKFNPSKQVLSFETLAITAQDGEGKLDRTKLKQLAKLIRPDSEGNIGILDFVKSCDGIYKEIRLLVAAIENSGQLDDAFETLFNWFFYFFIGYLGLAILGFDPVALFASISSLIISFAFMIGAAASKYFEGLLFVLVRRPYEIGDRVAISDPNVDTNMNGSTTWFVEKVGLFSTTVRLAATNEVATYSNGSLASSRVINANRSPKAIIYVYLKFGVDVGLTTIGVFKKTIEEYVKNRPREWLQLSGFRMTRVDAELGYMEYVIVLQHVESWQNLGAVLKSKAEVTSFSMEVSTKLDMKYTSPPLPVNLKLTNGNLGIATQLSETRAENLPGDAEGSEKLPSDAVV